VITAFLTVLGAVKAEMEKFRTERLIARSWQIEDLPLAVELWGDPAVTALIDARGKLTEAQVREKLSTEIERERSSGAQYWALFDHRNGDFVGCGGLRPWAYTPSAADFAMGFHLVKRCAGAKGSERKRLKARSNMRGKNCSCQKCMRGITQTIGLRRRS
jgi:hypothetical protein